MQEERKTNRWLIYILVALFGLVGGLIGWLYYRRSDALMAKECLIAGVIGMLVWFVIG